MSPRATQTHEQKQKPGTSLCSTGACSGMVPGMHSASDFENTGPNCAALLLVVWYRAGLAANGPAWGLQPHSSPMQLWGLGQGTTTCQGCPQRAEHPGQVLTRDQHPRVAPAPAQGAGCAALLGSLLGWASLISVHECSFP